MQIYCRHLVCLTWHCLRRWEYHLVFAVHTDSQIRSSNYKKTIRQLSTVIFLLTKNPAFDSSSDSSHKNVAITCCLPPATAEGQHSRRCSRWTAPGQTDRGSQNWCCSQAQIWLIVGDGRSNEPLCTSTLYVITMFWHFSDTKVNEIKNKNFMAIRYIK